MPVDSGFLKPAHTRLNVIQIMCDQLPYYALGCYGHSLARTPNIDALAAQGILFENTYAQNPICCPSRASQLSGLYPSNHGIMSNMNNLEIMNPQVRFLSDRFYEQGYATGHFGKWHCLRKHTDAKFTEFRFLEESIPIWPQHDIERFFRREQDPVFLYYGQFVHAATHPCSEQNTGPARITDWGVDFVERFAYKPFFLRLSYLGPHAPVLVPQPYDTMYDPDDIELPDFANEEFANRPQALRNLQTRCIQTRAQRLPEGMSSAQATRTHIAYNLGLISHIDDQIGRLLNTLKELGLEQNTLVMFTTDHGGFWGEHGLLEKAGCAHYRALLQLPLILRCPGLIPKGTRHSGFIEEVDFYPTLLDLAGVSQDDCINGQSFMPAILSNDGTGRADVFAEFSDGRQNTASLRDADWNFIWHARTQEAELYDMQADPDERYNLADVAKYEDVVHTMQQRLLSRMMNNRNVQIMPDNDRVNRSPIYLTPGRDEQGHEQALIHRFRGERVDEFPTTEP